MSVPAVVDALAERLAESLGAGTKVGDAAPSQVGDLPVVTLTVDDAEQRLVGVGRIPRGTRRGALAVDVEIDLADPTLDLGGGESLDLLSDDRRTLTVPHGPLVRADGTDDTPFGSGDVVVDDGAPFTIVDANPQGRQFVVDDVEGTLTFGVALAAAGTLTVRYHVAQWDVTVARVQGLLTVVVAAEDRGGVHDLARRVASVLDAPHPDVRLAPRSWGAVEPRPLNDSPAHAQQLAYRFDAEIEQPLLTSGGGVIRRVAVRVRQPLDGATADEPFDVTREGSEA